MHSRQSANFPILSLIAALLLIAGLGTGMLCTFFPARSPDHPKPDVPLLFQFDERWKNEPYGTSDLQSAGCAPTCIAMIFSYLNKDPEIDPVAIARFSESNGHYVDGVGTAHTLFADAAAAYHIEEQDIAPYEDTIDQALQENKLIIASMVPGHFTRTGHFIVLAGIKDNQYEVLDPNSEERSTLWDKSIVLDEMTSAWGFWKAG